MNKFWSDLEGLIKTDLDLLQEIKVFDVEPILRRSLIHSYQNKEVIIYNDQKYSIRFIGGGKYKFYK